MKTVFVVVEVPDETTTTYVEGVIFSAMAKNLVGPYAVTVIEDEGALIEYLQLDVVEVARDAMRGSR